MKPARLAVSSIISASGTPAFLSFASSLHSPCLFFLRARQ